MFIDPAALYPQQVLVDGDDLLVLEDGLVVWLEGAQVHGHEERRREDGPHGHLGLALLVGQPEVTDDQHVRVVPVAGPRVGDDDVLQVEEVLGTDLDNWTF